MAEEQNQDIQDDFYLGGEKISAKDDSWGGSIVSRDVKGFVKYVGNKAVERNAKSEATVYGGEAIVREKGKITKLGERSLDWREAEALQKYLDTPKS